MCVPVSTGVSTLQILLLTIKETNYLLYHMCAFTSYATYKQPLVQAHASAVYENTINHWMAFWNIYACTLLMLCNHGYNHLNTKLL